MENDNGELRLAVVVSRRRAAAIRSCQGARVRVFGLILCCSISCALAEPALGQSLHGRVVRADSATVVPGVLVTALDSAGAPVGTALSGPSGDYFLRLPRAGRYQLRALHIGFRPTVVPAVDVPSSGSLTRNVVLTELPVTIAGMDVREKDECGMSREETGIFVPLWEQARGALAATTLAEQSGELDVRVVTVPGHIDAVKYFRDPLAGPLTRAPHREADTVLASERIADRVFASTPAESLLATGYVRRRAQGGFAFDAPSADLLLSDGFAAQHCFGLTGASRGHAGWIGITFAPRANRDSLVDIRGVLWLDRTSAELRRLEFDYTNLPPGKFKVCDPEPPRSEFHELAGGPICDSLPANDRLGLGGDADFVRLGTGEWLVGRWTIRTPPDAQKFRLSGIRARIVGRSSEPCYSGKDCHDIWLPWPRLVTTNGIVASVSRAGVEIYRDSTATSLITTASKKRAGPRPSSLSGTIMSSDGRPLKRAIVQTVAPGRVAFTDSAGRFEIRELPPDSITTTVRCRGYQSIRFTLPMLPDSTRHIQLGLVPVGRGSGERRSSDCSTLP